VSKKKSLPRGGSFSASFAVRVWIEIDGIVADSIEDALAQAKTVAVGDVIDMCSGATMNDSYIDVVQVIDTKILDKVSA